MLASQISYFLIRNGMVESPILIYKIRPWFLKASQGHLCPRDFNVPWILLRNKCYLPPPSPHSNHRYWNCLSSPKAGSWLFSTPHEVLTSQEKLCQYDRCQDQITLATVHQSIVVVDSTNFIKFIFKLMTFVFYAKIPNQFTSKFIMKRP